MAQNTWTLPDTNTDINTGIVTQVVNALANLRTLHSGSTDPAGAGGAGATAFMPWWDSNPATPILKMRDSADSSWITVGDLTDNFGHLRLDGANAMTADLDHGGFVPKGIESASATAGPTHTAGDKWFSIKDTGGTKFFVHGQQTAP